MPRCVASARLTPPFGLAGGQARRRDAAMARTARGTTRPLNSKGAFRVPASGRVVMEAPGSGGYGPPEARDPALLADDLADGYVSPEAARRIYRNDGDTQNG